MQFLFPIIGLIPTGGSCAAAPRPIAVEPQVFDLLVYLVENCDRVVSKDDLIASVWRGRVVADSTLASRINAARKAVGDSATEQKLIRTIARRGIRFVGDVGMPTQRQRPTRRSRRAAAAKAKRRVLAGALPCTDRPAIAVLAFVNLSDDPEQEHFSDGLTEDIITALSKLRWFSVIARNSSFIYKGKTRSVEADRRGTGGRLCRRRQRAQVRRARAHHGSAQ